MRVFKILKAYFKGDLVVVVRERNNNTFSYLKGDNIDKRFILNSFTHIIKLNI